MDELREQYAQKKQEMKDKYKDAINAISNARGVDVGVAFDMLLAVCRGGDYIDGVADAVNGSKEVMLDIDDLNQDYYELCQISEKIARANGLID
jgi:hypothetical protein